MTESMRMVLVGSMLPWKVKVKKYWMSLTRHTSGVMAENPVEEDVLWESSIFKVSSLSGVKCNLNE